ncbi:MAG: 4Fe-4S binding protein [Desulfobacterales bacterium]|nr:4Fe-4S binding protein [Desulfobacterales bacterium]
MKVLRKIIKIDEELCDGCGQCILSCAEGALAIVDGKAKIVSENFCDGLGACIGNCPTGALKIIEREAFEFDEKAVEEHLKEKEKHNLPCGCPSSQIQVFSKNSKSEIEETDSNLTHWPIQIRLIPPKASFLKGASLLVLADCAAVAYVNLHRDLVKNRTVMMGCPKFDDAQAYIDKFTEIFKISDIKDIAIVFMDVPCCSGLPFIVKKALEKANKNIPYKEIIVSKTGHLS